MPRSVPATRMQDIADASRVVFSRKGYKRTQVADIAKEVGISPAALYRHVESKEALFHLCFLEQPPGVDEYLATPATGATIELVRARLRQAAPWESINIALRRRRIDDPGAELAGIIDELYRTVQHHWQLLALLEASARDLPQLAEAYLRVGRRGNTSRLEDYLRKRMRAGLFRTVEHPDLVALQIREACAWFAWHRRADGDTPELDDDAAVAAIIDVYVHALVVR